MTRYNEGYSLLYYVGSKYYIREKLVSYIPCHRTYVEVFGGSASVLFAKKPSRIEVYNDIWDDVIIFFKVLRERGHEFKEYLRLIPYSRCIYNEYKEKMKKQGFKDDFEHALLFFYLNKTSFNGNIGSGFATSKVKNHATFFSKMIDLLDYFVERLRNVVIECLDFRECIKKYDYEKAFFFCDPPYLDKKYYRNNFMLKDHEDLAEILHNIKGKVMLTYEYHPKVFELYNDWYITKMEHRKHASKTVGGTRGVIVDLMITNYKPVENTNYKLNNMTTFNKTLKEYIENKRGG